MDVNDPKVRTHMGTNCACFNLRRAARLVSQKYDQSLKKTGLKANQLSILIAAYDMGDRGMAKLAKFLGMERTTLTRNLSILERSGFLEITPGRDLREKKISITPKGKNILKSALPLWQKAQEEIVASIGDQAWQNLLSGLHAISRKI